MLKLELQQAVTRLTEENHALRLENSRLSTQLDALGQQHAVPGTKRFVADAQTLGRKARELSATHRCWIHTVDGARVLDVTPR